MSLEDQTNENLYELAAEHDVKGRSRMSREELIEALAALGIEGGSGQVSGFQQGVEYPIMPQTPDEFAALLDNPDKPAENQSAPDPEKLNPHLFGPQGRL